MKKIISLTIIATMLLSALILTSCDVLESLMNRNGQTVKTTVTEYDWLRMLCIKNYTVRITIGENIQERYVADNKTLFVSDEVEIINDYDVNGLNGIFYKTEYGWSGSVVDSRWNDEDLMLGSTLSLAFDSFGDAIYNEDEKCYTLKIDSEETNVSAKFYFEDGEIVQIAALGYVDGSEAKAEIVNIGKTTIDVSNLYILNDGKVEGGNPDKTVRTTVSESEFEGALSIKNVSARVLDSGLGSLYKFTENGFWIFDLHHDFNFDDGSETYAVKIDGVYCLLENKDGKYVLGANADSLIFQLVPGVVIDFADVAYSEEERYYEVELEPKDLFDFSRAYLYFEDGVLVKIAVVKCVLAYEGENTEPTPQYYEWILFLSDYGTTNIDFPEYEIVTE